MTSPSIHNKAVEVLAPKQIPAFAPPYTSQLQRQRFLTLETTLSEVMIAQSSCKLVGNLRSVRCGAGAALAEAVNTILPAGMLECHHLHSLLHHLEPMILTKISINTRQHLWRHRMIDARDGLVHPSLINSQE